MMKKPRTKFQRVRKRVIIITLVVLLIPAIQVASLWFLNPFTTGPMIIRWCSGKPNQYQWVKLDAVTDDFKREVWQWEDRHFFEHWGFDWEEIQKAREEAKITGKPARGASTITQQCARSLFLWQGRSWLRKGLEAYYTLWMEVLLSKRRIFEVYVNVVEFGDGIYGIEAGAQHHFGVSAKSLTPEQAALLVTVMPSPKTLNPNKPDERMLNRQKLIIERSQRVEWPINRKK